MTLKQTLFVRKYLQYGGNATQAVLEIYDVKSRNAAGVIGSRLLRNVKVRREIQAILKANRSIPEHFIALLKHSIDYGTPRERIKSLEIAFKLHGYL